MNADYAMQWGALMVILGLLVMPGWELVRAFIMEVREWLG